MNALIVYVTKTGHALEAAKAVAEGLRSGGATATIVACKDFGEDSLQECDATIIASPCHAGSLGAGVPGPISSALKRLREGALTGKRGGAVAVHSSMGGQRTVEGVGALMRAKGCEDFRAGPVVTAGIPFSLWKGPDITAEARERLRQWGETFATE